MDQPVSFAESKMTRWQCYAILNVSVLVEKAVAPYANIRQRTM